MRYKSPASLRPIKSRAPRSRRASEEAVRDLAQFRYALRKFLRFSENAARTYGITPQQHQLMLGVAGYTGHGSATVSELAEFLQERPHSVVGLIERAAQHGLVRRAQDKNDRRVVNVSLTASGKGILSCLTMLHQAEAMRIQELFGSRLATARTLLKGAQNDARVLGR
ncbi:MAG TPA: MarR family transcriptional regulator [Silvibacterium sp.]|nr:MarR family transcriptional regulator [Silvibacterium sp.]